MSFFHHNRSPIASSAQFQVAYERTQLSVFRYIYSLTGGPQAEAEDLTAETYLRAWKARHCYHGEPDRVIGWLIQIAKRLVIDDYRRLQRAERRQPPPPPSPDTPEEAALHNEDARRLAALLASLPADPREILTLRYSLGWQVKEIAAHMDMTESHVSVTIHRTLTKLRQQWPGGDHLKGENHDDAN
ncbi:MAG: sigma-70 family RNA polymerase sigma factor [Anaerolineales bacterium]|nr:sigma-70 family RNA polymerase sigma factor [Anaerolineales bacterium]